MFGQVINRVTKLDGCNIVQYTTAFLNSDWLYFPRRVIINQRIAVITWGPFLESPGNFSSPESHCKISNLASTELFYSRILKMKGGSLHTRSFERIHSTDTDDLKMALRARKLSGAFEKRAPGNTSYVTGFLALKSSTRDAK